MTHRERFLTHCAEVSARMRDVDAQSVFVYTVDSLTGGVAYTLWLREQGAMMLTIASLRGADYYDIRERLEPPKKGERIKL